MCEKEAWVGAVGALYCSHPIRALKRGPNWGWGDPVGVIVDKFCPQVPMAALSFVREKRKGCICGHQKLRTGLCLSLTQVFGFILLPTTPVYSLLLWEGP